MSRASVEAPMASRRAQRRKQTSATGTPDAVVQDRGGREIPRLRTQVITLGVMVAVATFINIVLYRLVERHIFYSPRAQSCAGPREEAAGGPGSSQNAPVSLLKTSLCLHPVSQYNLHDRQGCLPGQSCPRVRTEPGTEDSSSWRDLQPHLRETLCLHKDLVTLDPDTANRDLALSEDERRVSSAKGPHSRPADSPKRFTGCFCVLGREGFTSGRHYWEVQVLQENMLYVGVAQESVKRKVGITGSFGKGVWAVHRMDNGCYWALTSHPSPLYPRQSPKKLGLYLDYEGGLLSLYNADTWELLYTFNDTFTEQVHPFFMVYSSDLRLV
ncbi:E3 ubiquitin-protein ligase TRIM39-like isoform X2 [Lissotriton helveticus]